ncbi:hypothetical protein J5226_12725 [Lysobacter sp. K5869]|uniref:hypothetical protein n=1 Tax=Lysobacter sp. K5869 TaxID=2820808 RepID=UPI001C063BCF|nr:hypothetical protein [Lysobacter sp. K5869]QWP79189.1 hypothetical protein J5226_12725 [Lysobacter sp. K5869]
MDENLPETLHAIIYTSPSGGFVIGDRCKSLDCAINSIDPIGAGGETVYGRAIIDRVPGSALAYWKRHKEAAAEPAPRQSVTLTVAQILELAEFTGLHFDRSKMPPDEELECEYTISEAPLDGVPDDVGALRRYSHVAWITEYPEEGCLPLGPELTQDGRHA